MIIGVTLNAELSNGEAIQTAEEQSEHNRKFPTKICQPAK
jgi:hypothetical protein